jgi:hypothetical protein
MVTQLPIMVQLSQFCVAPLELVNVIKTASHANCEFGGVCRGLQDWIRVASGDVVVNDVRCAGGGFRDFRSSQLKLRLSNSLTTTRCSQRCSSPPQAGTNAICACEIFDQQTPRRQKTARIPGSAVCSPGQSAVTPPDTAQWK